MKTSYQSFLLTLLPRLVLATFTLQDQGPDWDYTTKDLAPSTSQKCKDAYIAPIDCDPTLLGLVASMRPLFKPTSQNLANTCTTECATSLETYVQNVKVACTADGDHAQESLGAAGNVGSIDGSGYKLDPVETVGQLFQYTMAQSCPKNSQGEWCYQQELNYPGSGLPCSDECSISFFKAAHDSPVSGLWFNYYFLISRGSWWAEEFVEGWKRVVECGKGGGVNEWLGSSGSPNTTMTASVTQTQTQSTSFTESGSGITATVSTTASPAASSSATTSVLSSTTTTASPSNVSSNDCNNLSTGSLLLNLLCWITVVGFSLSM